MADIRYAPAIVDTFNRPNEDPVQLPWKTDVGQTMRIYGNQFWGKSFPTAPNHAYYQPFTFTGAQMEVWGRVGFAGAALGDSWRFGFVITGSRTGYECLPVNGVGPDYWTIRKLNGSSFSTLATVRTGLPATNSYCLMQIDGPTISCYYSTTGATWTLKVSANDSAYRTNLHPHLGMTGRDTSWNDFGAGVPREIVRRPDIYRWVDAPGRA